jgi:hypothetical protein
MLAQSWSRAAGLTSQSGMGCQSGQAGLDLALISVVGVGSQGWTGAGSSQGCTGAQSELDWSGRIITISSVHTLIVTLLGHGSASNLHISC